MECIVISSSPDLRGSHCYHLMKTRKSNPVKCRLNILNPGLHMLFPVIRVLQEYCHSNILDIQLNEDISSTKSFARILSCHIWDIELNVVMFTSEANDSDGLYLCGSRIRHCVLLIRDFTRDIGPRRNLSGIISCRGIRS